MTVTGKKRQMNSYELNSMLALIPSGGLRTPQPFGPPDNRADVFERFDFGHAELDPVLHLDRHDEAYVGQRVPVGHRVSRRLHRQVNRVVGQQVAKDPRARGENLRVGNTRSGSRSLREASKIRRM